MRLMAWRAISVRPYVGGELAVLGHRVDVVGGGVRGARRQSHPLLHCSTQRNHFLRDTLAGWLESVNSSGCAGKWTIRLSRKLDGFSSSFHLKVSAIRNIARWNQRQNRLRLSCKVDECLSTL
jgi:hypothetical protein